MDFPCPIHLASDFWRDLAMLLDAKNRFISH